MAAALTTGLARALTGARRSATAAVTSAAAAAGRRGAGPAMLPTSAGRMVPMTQRLAALHGAAVVCSAGGEGECLLFLAPDLAMLPACSPPPTHSLIMQAWLRWRSRWMAWCATAAAAGYRRRWRRWRA